MTMTNKRKRQERNRPGASAPAEAPARVDPLEAQRAQLEALERVRAEMVDAAMAQGRLADAVSDARAAGATWEIIGQVLGVRRQAAYQRFGMTTAQVLGLDRRQS
jgi:hypothetical protein